MKRFVIVFVFALLVPNIVLANDYSEYIKNYDLSVFDETLDKDTKNALNELGVFDFDYSKISSLGIEDFIKLIKGYIFEKIDGPLKTCSIILIFVIISALLQTLKNSDNTYSEIYSTVTSLVISILLVTKLGVTVELSTMAISVAADFIYGFVPAFMSIVILSGQAATSISTNTTLLLLAQGLNFLSTNVFMPLINCFMAIGICSSLRYELHLDRLLNSFQKLITKCISLCAAAFVSILSIKTAVASRADAIGLRSIRFAINSVVPVIGSAISEGLLSIQSYSSLIKSSVGVVGIIAVVIVFLPSIVSVSLWRICIGTCNILSDTFNDRSVTSMLKAIGNTLLLINVVLILSMVTTIISIGILIAAGG